MGFDGTGAIGLMMFVGFAEQRFPIEIKLLKQLLNN